MVLFLFIIPYGGSCYYVFFMFSVIPFFRDVLVLLLTDNNLEY